MRKLSLFMHIHIAMLFGKFCNQNYFGHLNIRIQGNISITAYTTHAVISNFNLLKLILFVV